MVVPTFEIPLAVLDPITNHWGQCTKTAREGNSLGAGSKQNARHTMADTSLSELELRYAPRRPSLGGGSSRRNDGPSDHAWPNNLETVSNRPITDGNPTLAEFCRKNVPGFLS